MASSGALLTLFDSQLSSFHVRMNWIIGSFTGRFRQEDHRHHGSKVEELGSRVADLQKVDPLIVN